jgi:CheY-like chemotaxis protein
VLTGQRVLIVDQHPASRATLKLRTEGWGMNAAAVASEEEAMALIRDGATFDLALIDLHLPGAGAEVLAHEVRRVLAAPLPVIAVASAGIHEPSDAVVFNGFLTKPVKASRLCDALVDALASGGQPVRDAAPAMTGLRLADRHPLRVLVAEDNGVNQKVALAMLGYLGYRADIAADGVEAVAAVRRVPYDVVFMDLQMPELDGIGATRQIIAEHPVGRRPRIVALTANAYDEDREDCIAAGMDDYVSKPLKTETLEAALLRVRRLDAAT